MKLSNKMLIGGAGFLVLLTFAVVFAMKIGVGGWLESVVLAG